MITLDKFCNWWHARKRTGVSLVKTSQDDHPWEHPYLTTANIAKFRAYSEGVWSLALNHAQSNPKKLRCAFAVNMAQNMYKWACLANSYGAEVELFLHPQDNTAISMPQWEEYDGEFSDVLNGTEFLTTASHLPLRVPCTIPALSSENFATAYKKYKQGDARSLLHLLAESDGMHYEVFDVHSQFIHYFDWARMLSRFDVIYCASAPFAAYASGRPYCLLSVGGDLQFDCGRGDWYGRAMTLAFNGGRFLMISNPHTLGHSRRLGLTNGVYLPYPMDTSRYCPGAGMARARWETEFGPGVYVLTTARLDSKVKGHDEEFSRMLISLVNGHPGLRFVFLAWGQSADEFRRRVRSEGLERQLIVLNPVGKKRLIDYYRSCDIVLDQFVYGYFGATALEGAAIGKPVIMKLRAEQYAPLYAGDVAPVMNASTPGEIAQAILTLANDERLRAERGQAMRDWVVRHHGEEKTVPLMLALLQLAADRVLLPSDLVNPLREPLSEEEVAYHQQCIRSAS